MTNNVKQEEWRPIVGFEGYYEVSNLGRVRSLDRFINGRHGKPQLYRGKVLKPANSGNGYLRLGLCKSGIHKNVSLHRLLAIAFIPNPEGKPCINHIDGNPSNNDLENLEWCTYSENAIHAFKMGLFVPSSGKNNYSGRKTHCPRGHEYSEGNTYVTPNGGRCCKICKARQYKEHIARVKARNLIKEYKGDKG